jgi:hypothetical protein
MLSDVFNGEQFRAAVVPVSTGVFLSSGDAVQRVRFLIFETLALHVGQQSTAPMHLLQMLWPLLHSFMGGTMCSMH